MSDWRKGVLADEVAHLEAGVSVNADDRPHGVGERGVLKTSALSGGVFNGEENKAIWPKEVNRARVSPVADSILVSRMNTPALVGESAYVADHWPELFLPDRIWLLQMRDRSRCSVRWIAHLLQSHYAKNYVSLNATGTSGSMKNLPKSRLLAMPVAWPPRVEQRRIAEILDTLDEAIRKTEQIIAKLKQVKQGLLHDLLTRGIDDNAELRDPIRHPEQFKDSPLGRIPAAWNAKRLGEVLAGIDSGKSPNCPDRPASGSEWGVLKVSAVKPDGFQALENKALPMAMPPNPEHEVRDGDLLVTRANTPELVGLVCLVHRPPPRLLLCDKTLRLRVNGAADARYIFLAAQMPSSRRHIETHATGSSGSMKNISQSAIRAMLLPMPPMAEQAKIAAVLAAQDNIIDEEKQHTDKLRLLKRGLMEDLLTGRVRVSGHIAENVHSNGSSNQLGLAL